eukprot:6193582-Prymnesium_polylepis.1
MLGDVGSRAGGGWWILRHRSLLDADASASCCASSGVRSSVCIASSSTLSSSCASCCWQKPPKNQSGARSWMRLTSSIGSSALASEPSVSADSVCATVIERCGVALVPAAASAAAACTRSVSTL